MINPKAKIRTCKNKRDQHDLIDYDYIDKLSPAEQEFLATFTEDHYEGINSGRGKRRNDCYSTCSRVSNYSSDIDNLTPEQILSILEDVKK